MLSQPAPLLASFDMFTSIARSALVTLVASAIAVSATPGLTLKLSGASEVNGVDNLKIVTTLENTGDETLKLLNDPRGPLSKRSMISKVRSFGAPVMDPPGNNDRMQSTTSQSGERAPRTVLTNWCTVA